jgi:hypothetical protein
MWKHSMAGLALAVVTLAPGAQAQTGWSYSFTGFESEGVFDPALQIHGFFAGSDSNGDGILEQHELRRFSWNDMLLELGDEYCWGGIYCDLSGFRYSLDGQLDFRLDWRYSDDMAFSSGTTVAGSFIESAGSVGSGAVTGRLWRWTGQTRFVINPPPVPEPGQSAMLGAGLLGAAAWRAMRRRRL